MLYMQNGMLLDYKKSESMYYVILEMELEVSC